MTHFKSPIRLCPGCYISQSTNPSDHICKINIFPSLIRTIKTQIPSKDKIPRTIISSQSIAISYDAFDTHTSINLNFPNKPQPFISSSKLLYKEMKTLENLLTSANDNSIIFITDASV